MAGSDRWQALPADVLRPPPGPRTVVMVVEPPIRPEDIAGLCEEVRRLLGGDRADAVTCDVGSLAQPDLVVVDALARMQLAARQAGGSIRLRHAGAALLALLGLVGLDGVLPLCPEHHAVRRRPSRSPSPPPDRRRGLQAGPGGPGAPGPETG